MEGPWPEPPHDDRLTDAVRVRKGTQTRQLTWDFSCRFPLKLLEPGFANAFTFATACSLELEPFFLNISMAAWWRFSLCTSFLSGSAAPAASPSPRGRCLCSCLTEHRHLLLEYRVQEPLEGLKDLRFFIVQCPLMALHLQ